MSTELREEDVVRIWVRGLTRLVLSSAGRLYYWPMTRDPRPAMRARVTVKEAEQHARSNGFTWLARIHRAV